MTYELIENSEVNCDVYLDSGGVLDVTPHDPEEPYGFAYYEIHADGKKDYNVWHSSSEHNELQSLTEFDFDLNQGDIADTLSDMGFQVYRYYKPNDDKSEGFSFDSNHKSDV